MSNFMQIRLIRATGTPFCRGGRYYTYGIITSISVLFFVKIKIIIILLLIKTVATKYQIETDNKVGWYQEKINKISEINTYSFYVSF